jgi:hypothetical protein
MYLAPRIIGYLSDGCVKHIQVVVYIKWVVHY